MKRYYDLNGGANKDYDAVGRRGGASEIDVGGEKQAPRKNVHNEEKTKPHMSYATRKKEITRSGSPHRAGPGRVRGDFSNENKYSGNEVKTIYQNLSAMKKIIKENNPNSEEKLGRIYELLTLSMKNSMFENERRRLKDKENIQQIGNFDFLRLELIRIFREDS